MKNRTIKDLCWLFIFIGMFFFVMCGCSSNGVKYKYYYEIEFKDGSVIEVDYVSKIYGEATLIKYHDNRMKTYDKYVLPEYDIKRISKKRRAISNLSKNPNRN